MVCAADGTLVEKDEQGVAQKLINREVGEPGFDIAWHGLGISAFVNDVGHLSGLPRNVVGTCLLASVVARRCRWTTPLAGPIVITGWVDEPWPSEEPETRSLTNEQVSMLRLVHADLRVLLGLDEGDLSEDAQPGWQQLMRELADFTAAAPAPTIQVLTGGEALNYLLGGRP